MFWLRLQPRLLPGYSSGREEAFHRVLLGVSVGLMVVGTIWAFLPNSGHGGVEE